MIRTDRSVQIVLVNHEAERLFGYAREELLGKPIEMLVPERVRGRHPLFRLDFLKNPQTRAMGAGRDLFGLRRDGTEVPVEIGLNPIETDEGQLVLASVVDISARKRAEARFRAAVESAPNGMVMIDGSGKIILVNREIERLFGYSREELLGQPIERLLPAPLSQRDPGYRPEFFCTPRPRPAGASGVRHPARNSLPLRRRAPWAPAATCSASARTASNSRSRLASIRSRPRKACSSSHRSWTSARGSGLRRSCAAPTRSWSASRTLPPTTSRSRCGWSGVTSSCWASAIKESWTPMRTSSSALRWTARCGCSG